MAVKLNVSINEFEASVDRYRASGMAEESVQILLWFWGYSHNELGGDADRMAELIGYDKTTVYRVCAGKYEGSLDNVIEAMGRAKRQQEGRVSGIIRTPVVDRIWEALDYCKNMGTMVVIRGETGRGKTFAAREWQRNNNHGRSVYVRATTGATKSMMLRGIASALGIATKSKSNVEMLSRVQLALGRQARTLIVDEAGHLVPKSTRSGSTAALDVLRDFHDTTGCGIALIVTDVYWDQLRYGPLSAFFEQFLGRVTFDVHIPEGKIFAEELAAICGRYVADAPADLLKAAREIAEGEGKLRALFADLANAVAFAKRRGGKVTAQALRQAHGWRTAGGVWPEE